MPAQKSLSAGAPRPTAASGRRQRSKGDGRTQMSRTDLEQMLFEAARMRAANAYRRDQLVAGEGGQDSFE